MNVEEKCVYRVDPNNPDHTLCEKKAWVTSGVFGVAGAIQAFGIDRFKKNAAKASRGFDHVLTAKFEPEVHQPSSAEKLKEKALAMAHVATVGKEKAQEKARAVAQAATTATAKAKEN